MSKGSRLIVALGAAVLAGTSFAMAETVNGSTTAAPDAAASSSTAKDNTITPDAPSSVATIAQETPQPMVQGVAWLGIALEPVPEVVIEQWPEDFKTSRGVVIAGVNPRSPAAQAGLQKNDILLSYEGEPLQSPNDLMERVHSDHPEQKITMSLLRKGKPMEVEVVLGKRASSHAIPPHPDSFRPIPAPAPFQQWLQQHPRMPQGGRLPAPAKSQANASGWTAFESFQVNTLPHGKVHAEVDFKTPKGESKHYIFEGTREDVQKQIQSEQGLTNGQKAAVLNALNLGPLSIAPPQEFMQDLMQGPKPEVGQPKIMPPAIPMPAPEQFGFAPPSLPKNFFDQNMLDDPFFKQFFQSFEGNARFPELPSLPKQALQPPGGAVPLTPPAPAPLENNRPQASVPPNAAH